MLQARGDPYLDKVLNCVVVVLHLIRTGKVLENGNWPYEGTIGERRKQKIIKFYDGVVVPVFTLLIYISLFYIFSLVRRMFRAIVSSVYSSIDVLF